tara:strand:- start:1898 stop:2308 length:411 start_codon:yes stop_codon:yes gene_type:complete
MNEIDMNKKITDNIKKVMKKKNEEKAAKAHKELKKMAKELYESNYLDYLYFITNQIDDDTIRTEIKNNIKNIEEEIKKLMKEEEMGTQKTLGIYGNIETFRNNLNNFIDTLEKKKKAEKTEEDNDRTKYNNETLTK